MHSRISFEQIENGLPPVGVAASIEAADLATGFVRAALLDPSLVLLPPAQCRPAPTSARVWASSAERVRVVAALFAAAWLARLPRPTSPLGTGARW